MKIVIVSALYPPRVIGGAEISTRATARALVEEGHEVHVLTLVPDASNARPSADDDGVQVHGVPLANLYWPYDERRHQIGPVRKLGWHLVDTDNPVMRVRVRRLVARIAPDVVLSKNLQGFSTGVLPAIAELGIPVVHTLHDFALLCPRAQMYRKERNCAFGNGRCGDCKALTAPRRRHLDAVSAVIGVSRFVIDVHRDHGLFTGLPARAIHNAVRLPLASAPRRIPALAPITFGFLGRVEAAKGIETLLEACAGLQQSGSDFRLLVGGRGQDDYLSRLRRRWPQLPLEYTGFIAPMDFYQRVDVMVQPTRSLEALGSAYEAYARAVPVIGTNAGGIAECIDDGSTGFVVPVDDSAALADRMRRVVDSRSLHARLSAGALARAGAHDARTMARDYVQVLESACSARLAA